MRRDNKAELHGISLEPPSDDVLATLRVDLKSHSVQLLSSKRKPPSTRKRASKKRTNAAVDSIWSNIESGKVNLSYAYVGYTYDGRPVVEHELALDLLMQYGYTLDDAVAFMQEFGEVSTKGGSAPVVMLNINTSRMMSEVEPLSDDKPSQH